MNISETFAGLKQKNETALLLYYTAGYPDLQTSMENIRVLAENGADLIEIGIPFSDPIADGPMIQEASQTALRQKVTLKSILKAVRTLDVPCPLIMMSYLNPLLAYGIDQLMADMVSGGITGMIIPDLPVEEANEWIEQTRSHGIDLIFLVTPTSGPERVRLATDASGGFVYCVSLTGTTGAREQLNGHLPDLLKEIKSISDKPVAVGFGVSTPAHVRELRPLADGVIVGSRILKAVSQKEDLGALARSLKTATQHP